MDGERNPLTGRPFSKKYYEILAKRKTLPCYPVKDEFLKLVAENQVTVLVGETGSGKTTQMGQFLYDVYGDKGVIGITQPRRVAAMSVAARVADEADVELGEEVGYTIRFEDKTSEKTKIKYMTDGMFLRECMTTPDMPKYSVLMLDEAHERTLSTDIIFGLLKEMLPRRPDLKVVVMSATLDAEKFQGYFNDAPLMKVSGRMFPVDTFYTMHAVKDYVQTAIDVVSEIHFYEAAGDVLLFLTGEQEIETACEGIREACLNYKDKGPVTVLPLYSALPLPQQRKVFEPAEGRKIVVATNVAETSITIDGIVYVVDPGLSKQNVYNPRTHVSSLLVSPISRAAAKQRAGRAGRTQDGKCFRLYTKPTFDSELEATCHPEILRSNLSQVLLTLKKLNIDDVVHFDYMDPPAPETMMRALEDLNSLGAIDDEADMTDIGRIMAEMPLEPELSRVLITSGKWGVLEEALTVVAMLSVPTPFLRDHGTKAAAKAHRAFEHASGDHLTLVQVYNAFQENRHDAKNWCWNNYLSERSLAQASNVRRQLANIAKRQNIENVRESKDIVIDLRKALLEGYFMQVAHINVGGKNYTTMRDKQVVTIHPSSFLTSKPEWIVYHELALTDQAYVRTVSSAWGEMLLEVAPEYCAAESEIITGHAQEALEKIRRKKRRTAK